MAIFFLALWCGQSALVDLFVIPSLFRGINDVEVAGKIGAGLFSGINILEMIYATALVYPLLLVRQWSSKRLNLIAKIIQGLVCLLPFYYTFYLTPTIARAAKAALNGSTNAAETLGWSHQLYTTLDATKLVLLLIIIALQFIRISALGSNPKRNL